ncbi:helix-turn-helix domain-containing protein [Alkalibacillus aidingensis]|uniref:helix-turn-helix domain-containing protein n=1 Tax=Alkalibacillus aidingensis TaxID=2747607 RepID=UPI00166112BF|nr:helix-turn-helix transcriptional regulator [Alkalibacillus aidingensis]
MLNLGTLIQYYRTKKGVTQKELANGICSISYLSKIENGSIEPRDDVIKELCERLDVPFERLTSINHEIDDEILNVYKLLTKKNYQAAQRLLNELKQIITPFHSAKTQNFFKLIEFYYLIEYRQTEELDQRVDDLLSLEEQFHEEHLYFFYKIIGMYYNFKASPNQAINYLRSAENLLEQLSVKDPTIYYLLAVTYTSMDRPAYSNHYCQLAKELFISEFLYPKVTDCYILFGINYTLLKVYDLAESFFRQVLNSKPMMDADLVNGWVKHNLGFLYSEKGDWHLALQTLKEALDEESHLNDQLTTTYLIAKVYYYMQENEMASEYINKGERLSLQLNNTKLTYKLEMLRYLVNDTYTETEFREKAFNLWIPYFKRTGDFRSLKETLKYIAKSFEKSGDYKQANQYFKKILHE